MISRLHNARLMGDVGATSREGVLRERLAQPWTPTAPDALEGRCRVLGLGCGFVERSWQFEGD